jgi:hypothetical protein
MDYPSLLKGKNTKVLAISKETIIAEKFEAIVQLSTFNSRMKDFFDIVFLAHEFDFDGSVLQSAIRNTFQRRKTEIRAALEIMDSDFDEKPNLETSWEAFKKRSKRNSGENFKSIFAEIRQFLKVVVASELDNKMLNLIWHRKTQRWEEENSKD